MLFDGPHDHERWDVRWRQQQVVVETFEYVSPESADAEQPDLPGPDPTRSKELFAIVTVTRGKGVSPMRMGYRLRTADVAAIAIHAPDHAEAVEVLERLGWHRTADQEEDA